MVKTKNISIEKFSYNDTLLDGDITDNIKENFASQDLLLIFILFVLYGYFIYILVKDTYPFRLSFEKASLVSSGIIISIQFFLLVLGFSNALYILFMFLSVFVISYISFKMEKR